MRISFIGAGRVATHLAKAFQQHHKIVEIYSRSIERAELLATQLNSSAVQRWEQMSQEIDLLVLAISDQSISSVIQEVSTHFKDVLIVHTSGSTHLHALTEYHWKSGVFYPLQTFSLEREIEWSNTPLFIETHQEQDLVILQNLAEALSQRVYAYDSVQRLSLHLAAVFACNFSNYCYDMAKQVVDAKAVDFSLLYPLILETAKKATVHDPKTVQTGPAVRGDQNILNMHQQMLSDLEREDLKQIYALMSQGIQRD